MSSITGQQTVNQTLTLLAVIQPGETPNTSESNDALSVINNVLDNWAIQRLQNISIAQVSVALTAATRRERHIPGEDADRCGMGRDCGSRRSGQHRQGRFLRPRSEQSDTLAHADPTWWQHNLLDMDRRGIRSVQRPRGLCDISSGLPARLDRGVRPGAGSAVCRSAGEPRADPAELRGSDGCDSATQRRADGARASRAPAWFPDERTAYFAVWVSWGGVTARVYRRDAALIMVFIRVASAIHASSIGVKSLAASANRWRNSSRRFCPACFVPNVMGKA